MRKSKEEIEAAIEEARESLYPRKDVFLEGDQKFNSLADFHAAIEELDRLKDQLPDWAYTIIVGLAHRGAESFAANRKRGEKTSYQKRNDAMCQVAYWLAQRGFSTNQIAKIIHNAVVSLGYARITKKKLTVDYVDKFIRPTATRARELAADSDK